MEVYDTWKQGAYKKKQWKQRACGLAQSFFLFKVCAILNTKILVKWVGLYLYKGIFFGLR